MNLHAVVSGAISAINPPQRLSIQQSTGSVTQDDFTRTPTYRTVSIIAQVQAMSGDDLRLVESLNIQGQHRKCYANGQYFAVVRATQKGGDIVTRPDGTKWKITVVSEPFDTAGWCSFIMTMQNNS